MCGIAGYQSYSKKNDNERLVGHAIAELVKRGPDHQAIRTAGNVALGHARLSIIDTSSDANQPFTDPSGRYTIVFNGEIFNYRELREQLIRQGVPFRSQSDTEVLLHLYIIKGRKMLQDLNGFFSFCIHDSLTGELFLARDRFGVKPLVFHRSAESFAFASEMKAILAMEIPAVLNPLALSIYFHLHYIPAPATIFSNIFKLPPGHCMTIQGGTMEIEPYYKTPAFNKSDAFELTYDEAQIELRRLLNQAVEDRLVSDVPLGTFLSGGIDSSIVSTLAARKINRLNTFSIGFTDHPSFDETRYADLVAKKAATVHTAFRLSDRELFQNLDEMLEYIDEPFADSSALAVYILSKHTRKHVTVALSGDGADELFGGYHKHLAEHRMRNFTLLNYCLKALPIERMNAGGSRNSRTGNFIRQIKKYQEGLSMSTTDRYWRWAGYLNSDAQMKVTAQMLDPLTYTREKNRLCAHITGGSSISDMLENDVALVLPGDMLTKVDLMSMANSLEVRVPFLDYRLVEFASKLPADYKIRRGMKKSILQDAFSKDLPKELYNRRKQGFEIPLLSWFQGKNKAYLESHVLNDAMIRKQNLIHPDFVGETRRKLFSNQPGDSAATTWAMLVFQHWYERYRNRITVAHG